MFMRFVRLRTLFRLSLPRGGYKGKEFAKRHEPHERLEIANRTSRNLPEQQSGGNALRVCKRKGGAASNPKFGIVRVHPERTPAETA